jgi:chromate reductase
MALIVLIGGISRQSINRKLFAQLKTVSAMEFDLFEIAALPFFSQDLEVELPAEVVDFKKRIKAAEGVLVITPEYNRSIPGVLKNALDWGSRPWGENSWSDKPAAIMGASTGAVATFGAQQHLRNVMSFLNMHVMSQPEYYLNFTANVNSDGILNPGAMGIAANFMKAADKWFKIFAR